MVKLLGGITQHDVSALHIDVTDGTVWVGSRRIELRPTPCALLCYLAAHAGQLVSKEALLRAVWPDTQVSSAVLKAYIQQLRKALGDNAATPRFIETVQRRGYRFIATVTTTSQGPGVGNREPDSSPTPTPAPWSSPPLLVGRAAELAQLRGCLAKARRGERQIVFVTGEPGIGKTTLVENFLFGVRSQEAFGVRSHEKFAVQRAKLQTTPNSARFSTPNLEQSLTPDPWLAVGQCIEHAGTAEAYFPLLDAIGRLCRDEMRERCTTLLRQYAPTWLLQMPWLVDDSELDALRQRTHNGTPARMLRELAEFLEALTGPGDNTPTVILVIEDLHWSDVATLDLLALLARRREFARLLIIGTYRPQEATQATALLFSITRELLTRGMAEELPVPVLTEPDIAAYVARHLPVSTELTLSLPEMAQAVYARTEGNPLFMVSVVQHLRQALWTSSEHANENSIAVALSTVPANLQQLIDKQFVHLSVQDQRLLESASVVGLEFSTAAVAAGLGDEITEVEQRASTLAQQGLFVHAQGIRTWPDGTVTGHYRFVHALYQEALVKHLAPGWRTQLHRRVGNRLEAGFAEQASIIAAELVRHFEQGQEFQRLIPYCIHAAQTALGRFAYREALLLLDKGLAALQQLPATPERNQQEVILLCMRFAPLLALEGYGSEDAFTTLLRARALCEQNGYSSFLPYMTCGLAAVTLIRGDLPAAHKLGEHALALAQHSGDAFASVWAHLDVGETSLFRGEIATAHHHFLRGKTLSASMAFPPATSLLDPGVMCTAMLGWSFFMLGYPEQAVATIHQALERARHEGNPYTLALTLVNAAAVYGMKGDGGTMEQLAREALTLAREHAIAFWEAWATTSLGAALALQGDCEQSRRIAEEGIAAQHRLGCRSGAAGVLAFVAESYARQAQSEVGLSIIVQAEDAMRTTGEYLWEPHLLQIKGELTIQKGARQWESSSRSFPSAPNPESSIVGPASEAEACFHHAITIAQRQEAKAWELQATISLARLWRAQGKNQEAHRKLSAIYSRFTEGLATRDLQAAKRLLDELATTFPSSGTE